MTTPSQPYPVSNDDGTRTAIVVAPPRLMGGSFLWSLHLPEGLTQEGVSGRFFLARCGATTDAERAEQWEIYRRRPLYAIQHRPVGEPPGVTQWDVLLPSAPEQGADDPGYRWLRALPAGTPINVVGPLGQGYALQATSRNLLLLADPITAPLLLGIGDQMLDRGGRVTLLLQLYNRHNDGPPDLSMIVDQWPIAIEVRQAATSEQWQAQLAETVRWADQVAVALPYQDLAPLKYAIQQQRFRLEAGFVHAFIQADLLCGVGTCLSCVVPTHDSGYTRACIHGPVFDLLTLV